MRIITDNNACTCASMGLFTDMLQQHSQMLLIFTKRHKVSMICGSQNMNSIILLLVLVLCKLRYCLIINLLSSRVFGCQRL